jgi:hypothetical protein
MKKKLLFVIAALITLTIYLKAQECVFYYPETKGAELVYKSFDKKGKLSATTSQKVTEYSKTANGAEATIHVKSSDDKGKNISESDLHVKCEAGTFYFDMEGYLNQQALKGMEGMEIKMEHDNLQMPSNMKVGDKLKDGWIKLTVTAGGMTVMTMEITISNRLVEKKESITTEAGTFECLKINQTVTSKVPMKIESKSSEWLSKGTGLIKSESYSSDGSSITSSMLLSEIKK